MIAKAKMRDLIFNFFKENAEDLVNFSIISGSIGFAAVGVDTIPNITELKIVVENIVAPSDFLDRSNKILSNISFLFSISLSIWGFVRFTKSKRNDK